MKLILRLKTSSPLHSFFTPGGLNKGHEVVTIKGWAIHIPVIVMNKLLSNSTMVCVYILTVFCTATDGKDPKKRRLDLQPRKQIKTTKLTSTKQKKQSSEKQILAGIPHGGTKATHLYTFAYTSASERQCTSTPSRTPEISSASYKGHAPLHLHHLRFPSQLLKGHAPPHLRVHLSF